ncbi:glycoside hydrolase family 16 protein [Rickenella mellea]|uniref:Glycoside hydrolase family 16 protein n=1 Tax=Rickenella mellea TaxID=50990 RepID=A0A4V6PN24_9AGAM|nr:glycoside hydrolase family 16 protein [Rickenella mellea]
MPDSYSQLASASPSAPNTPTGSPRPSSLNSFLPPSRQPTPSFMAQLRSSRDSNVLSSSASSITSSSGFAYPQGTLASLPASVSEKYSLSADPRQWGADLSPNLVEEDDFLHNPDPKRDLVADRGHVLSSRGVVNVGCLSILCVSLIALFAGYPVISYFTRHKPSNLGGFNLGGINASGQVPIMAGNWGLIDKETPQEAYTRSGWNDGSDYELVFSDEFNQDGRTFYPGDDPYWEAVDLHYWATNNLEWYDPGAVITKNGSLQITLSAKDPINNHNLSYQGGMVSTWNKFCFTGGYIETKVSLPGVNNVIGLWPAVWTMGNLGRAGYGASLEGLWPYTYDTCDVGTAPNQTFNGLPINATINGDTGHNGELSFLPGQRLSRCTCAGESHPGPMHSDGTYVGRAAPEIDVFEAQMGGKAKTGYFGQVSQSAQWAPFNYAYEWLNTTDNMIVPNPSISQLNTYTGSILQQATSVVSNTDPNCYTGETGCFSIYGFEYKPGFDGAYITWISNDKVAWTLKQAGMGADPRVQIGSRPVPQEPMYIIANLGMSKNFGDVDLADLIFPAVMQIDYIRVYQPKDAKNIGCDPPDFPTAAYIQEYVQAYTDANLTTWRGDYNQPFPKNSFLGQC